MKCISYNQPEPHQTEQAVALMNPFSPTGKFISIDACIAPAIRALLAAGIETKGSCCTHGKGKPEVILKDNATPEEIQKARAVIATADKREYVILSWALNRYEVPA